MNKLKYFILLFLIFTINFNINAEEEVSYEGVRCSTLMDRNEKRSCNAWKAANAEQTTEDTTSEEAEENTEPERSYEGEDCNDVRPYGARQECEDWQRENNPDYEPPNTNSLLNRYNPIYNACSNDNLDGVMGKPPTITAFNTCIDNEEQNYINSDCLGDYEDTRQMQECLYAQLDCSRFSGDSQDDCNDAREEFGRSITQSSVTDEQMENIQNTVIRVNLDRLNELRVASPVSILNQTLGTPQGLSGLTSAQGAVGLVSVFINIIIGLGAALGFLALGYSILNLIIVKKDKSATELNNAINYIIFSIIALVVILFIWGLRQIFLNTFGLSSNDIF